MKNRYRRKSVIFSMVLFFAAVIASGCSLAVEEAAAEESAQLIGAFITEEYLSLLDMDAFFQDHAGQLADGRTFSGAQLSGYQQKVYAAVNKNGSSVPSDWTVSFPGLDGICFFAPLWTDENGDSCREGVYGSGICEQNLALDITDAGKTLELTGTIYKSPDAKTGGGLSFFLNPVYQTADGAIYLTSGTGNSIHPMEEYRENECLTASLSDETKRTEDGKTTVEKTSVTIKLAVMYRPVKITLCQMNQEHQLIKKNTYQPEKIPPGLRTEEETAYILYEMEKESPSGKKAVSRKVLENHTGEESVLDSFYAAENGIILTKSMEIEWTEDFFTAENVLFTSKYCLN